MKRWLMILCVLAGCSSAATHESEQAFAGGAILSGPGQTCSRAKACKPGLFCAHPDLPDFPDDRFGPGVCTATSIAGTVIWCSVNSPRDCPKGMKCVPLTGASGESNEPDGGADVQGK